VATRSFTTRFQGKSRILVNEVGLFAPFNPATEKPGRGVNFMALWDTGATNTVITQKVVDALGLQSTGFATVSHAQGKKVVETYFVNIMLPNGVGVPMLKVTKGELDGPDLLIGMDIIGAGDFAVTNYQNRTVFTFRVPSCHEIDFVKQPAQAPAAVQPGRNDPCFCGSGKKYKKCHGKS